MKWCKRIVLLGAVILLLLVFSCVTKKERAANVKKDLIYFKDSRTGLCFAATAIGYQGFLAHVPCDKVQKYLVEKE
ncbi:hypothetical protein LCGC14_1496120 [marine sediment metagenome]|uniref:Lipoprotein n=1 Tax=marine sediment metagenome TaxID=412755 RepID=A0A0F9J5Y9_9ZZZZ